MASLSFISFPSSPLNKIPTSKISSFPSKNPFPPSSVSSNFNSLKPLKFSAKDDQENNPNSSSSVTVVSEKPTDENGTSEGEDNPSSDEKEMMMQQESDWKTDEEFKKFMGNPSIEAAIKLEKKRTDRKLKELDKEAISNPVVAFLNGVLRDRLSKEKERLEKAEEAFKALDLNKLKNCFGFDTFFATDVRRFGDGGIFIGNLRKPIEVVMPVLEKKLADAAGREVVLWFMEENADGIKKQAFSSDSDNS